MSCKLYRIRFALRPTPQHPSYFEVQFCFLNVWLSDESPEAAKARAIAILDQLPYEQPVQPEVFCDEHIPQAEKHEQTLFGEAMANALGIGLKLYVAETGSPDPFPEKAP